MKMVKTWSKDNKKIIDKQNEYSFDDEVIY